MGNKVIKQYVKVIPNCSFCPYYKDLGLRTAKIGNGLGVGSDWYCSQLERVIGFDNKEEISFPEIPKDCPLDNYIEN